MTWRIRMELLNHDDEQHAASSCRAYLLRRHGLVADAPRQPLLDAPREEAALDARGRAPPPHVVERPVEVPFRELQSSRSTAAVVTLSCSCCVERRGETVSRITTRASRTS